MSAGDKSDNIAIALAANMSLIADLFALLWDKGLISNTEIAELVDTYSESRCFDQVKKTIALMPDA